MQSLLLFPRLTTFQSNVPTPVVLKWRNASESRRERLQTQIPGPCPRLNESESLQGNHRFSSVTPTVKTMKLLSNCEFSPLIILPLLPSMPSFLVLSLMGQSCLCAHFPLYFSFSHPSLLLQLLKLYFLICKYCNQISIEVLFHLGNIILFQWNWTCLIKNMGQQWGRWWKLWVLCSRLSGKGLLSSPV